MRYTIRYTLYYTIYAILLTLPPYPRGPYYLVISLRGPRTQSLNPRPLSPRPAPGARERSSVLLTSNYLIISLKSFIINVLVSLQIVMSYLRESFLIIFIFIILKTLLKSYLGIKTYLVFSLNPSRRISKI